MALVCEACGHKTNEIKSGGGIEPLGKRIELRLERREDLCRDVLKSETCVLEIPELEFEGGSALIAGESLTRRIYSSSMFLLTKHNSRTLKLNGSGSAGKFTTVEGLLEDLISNLGLDNPFLQGDSAGDDRRSKLEKFLERLQKIKSGDEK